MLKSSLKPHLIIPLVIAVAVCVVLITDPWNSLWRGTPQEAMPTREPPRTTRVDRDRPSDPEKDDSTRAREKAIPSIGVPDFEDDPQEERARQQRLEMVRSHLMDRDITDKDVLSAMGRVKRHLFVAEDQQSMAYDDHPLPIGHGQTISQPYIVALMTQLARPTADARALDVGTGSGYQAAVLAEIVDQVYSIEIVCPLADQARERLQALGYDNVEVRCGDGYEGWPDQAPFDVIIVAAAPDHVPQPLVDQLAPGGRLVIPVGGFDQELMLIEKTQDGSLRHRTVAPVRFVPLVRGPEG